jgi:hypothetical protein
MASMPGVRSIPNMQTVHRQGALPGRRSAETEFGHYLCLRGGLPIRSYSFTEKYVAKHPRCWAIHLSESGSLKLP